MNREKYKNGTGKVIGAELNKNQRKLYIITTHCKNI